MEIEQEKAQRRALGVKALGLFNPDEVSGLGDAIKDENLHWDLAFIGLEESICGFKVKPFSTRHLLFLALVKSPFLLNAPSELFQMTPGISNHIQRFMWIVSKGFKPEAKFRRKLFFFCYHNFFAKRIKINKAVDSILEYINKSMADYGKSGSGNNFYSVAAETVHLLCSKYHFTFDQALDCPLKIVFQLAQCNQRQNGNPIIKRSDVLVSEWLEKENRKILDRN